MTASIRAGIDSMSRRHRSGSVAHHSFSRRSQSASTEAGTGPTPTRRFRSAQRCSIGFRSGLCDGQGSVATWFRASQSRVLRLTWMGSLSCWNVYGASEDDRSHPLEGSICRSRISTYTAEFIFMKMRHALPTPRADMQPHIKSAPPPNFPLALMRSSFVSSEKMTFCQSLTVQWRWSRAHCSRRRLCNFVRVGARALTLATRPCRLSARR